MLVYVGMRDHLNMGAKLELLKILVQRAKLWVCP